MIILYGLLLKLKKNIPMTVSPNWRRIFALEEIDNAVCEIKLVSRIIDW